MSQAFGDTRWQVLAHSQQGASHVRNGLPNQDAIDSSSQPDGSPPLVLAVSDGHGSDKCFRSHIGSKMAVEVAVEVCSKFIEGLPSDIKENAVASGVKQVAEQQIPREIVGLWRARVSDHCESDPFTEPELSRLPRRKVKDGQPGADSPSVRFEVAYGATLLIVIIHADFMICFQLGDGEILVVSATTGEVSRAIPRDESLIANETSSLCQEEVLKDFRCRFQLFQNSTPGLILLTTDGYSNSFASDDDFFKAGTDFLQLIREEGWEHINNSIPNWLEEASRDGSGDDVTLGIIVRMRPTASQDTEEEQDSSVDIPPDENYPLTKLEDQHVSDLEAKEVNSESPQEEEQVRDETSVNSEQSGD